MSTITIWENPEYVRQLQKTWAERPADMRRIAGFFNEFMEKRPDNFSPRVVDVGCGAGRAAEIFPRLSYVGIDGSKELVDICKKKKLWAIHGSIFDIPAETELYNFVLCHAVLCHLGDVPAAIAELWRVTKPGGRLVYSCYYTNWPFHKGVEPVWVDLPESGGGVFQPKNLIPRWMVKRQAAKLQPNPKKRQVIFTYGETGPDDRLAYVVIDKDGNP